MQDEIAKIFHRGIKIEKEKDEMASQEIRFGKISQGLDRAKGERARDGESSLKIEHVEVI